MFGVKDTLACLEMGAVETLIVWENLEITRYVFTNPSSGAQSALPCFALGVRVPLGSSCVRTTGNQAMRVLQPLQRCVGSSLVLPEREAGQLVAAVAGSQDAGRRALQRWAPWGVVWVPWQALGSHLPCPPTHPTPCCVRRPGG